MFDFSMCIILKRQGGFDVHSSNFENIPVNREDIPQNILDIDIRTRTNPFAWNGQFSPQFVEALLEKYSLPEMLVIDPFTGSGTTMYECVRKELAVYGTEINASAFHMAKIYEAANLQQQDRKSLISEIDDLILSLSMSGRDITESLIHEINTNPHSFYSNILSTLVILMDIYSNPVSSELLQNKWRILAKIIAGLPYSRKTVRAERCDARFISLNDSSVDMLITSPPYINVFNYHQKYRRSVEALGYDVLNTAKSEIGSNRKNRSNRFLTVIQYCIDMAMVLDETSRVCTNNARMIYVVGRESKVMGCPFCNSRLIYEIGTQIIGLELILRQERRFMNRYGQLIYEDILHFSNSKGSQQGDDSIIASSTRIAVNMLEEKLTSADKKTLPLLRDAISMKDSVKPSERLLV